MILWTVQTIAAWQRLQSRGRLQCQRRHIDPWFIPAYGWMAKEMRRRLRTQCGPPHGLPLWGWYQWEGEKRRRPDLRGRGYLESGEHGVRLEVELGDSEVLLSDFDLWHYVLNYWYLPESVSDAEVFERELAGSRIRSRYGWKNPISVRKWRLRIEKSWERIFDLDFADKRREIAEPRQKKSIQATFWELPFSTIRSVTEFRAR